MTRLNQLNPVACAMGSTAPPNVFDPPSRAKSVFFGPDGLRVGWRLLIFIVLLAVLIGGTALIDHGGLQGLWQSYEHRSEVTVTPFLMGVDERE